MATVTPSPPTTAEEQHPSFSSTKHNSNNNVNGASSSATVASTTRQAARGTVTTVGLRLLSFVGTQWCVRRLSPEALGRASGQLELGLASILFVAREGFRLAAASTTVGTSSSNSTAAAADEAAAIHRTAWLTLPVTAVLAGAALLLHLGQTQPSASLPQSPEDADFRRAGSLYCLAALIEGCAEPAVLWFLRNCMSVAEKAAAEGVAALVKTAVTVVLLQSFEKEWPVTALGGAQCAYAVTYFVIMYGQYALYFWRHPHRAAASSSSANNTASRSSYWHGPTLRLTGLFTAQGLLKFALQEGDRILLTLLSDSYNQGVYAMGSAYGGLAARLILQPVEENARLLFGRLSSSTSTASSDSQTSSDTDKNATKQPQPSSRLGVSYTVLVKAVLYVGLIFSCLATNYTGILLSVLAGRTWGHNPEAVSVLSAFCVYTAFLAWNGTTEAFVYGVARTATDVGRLGAAHTVTGLLFGVLAPVAVARYGTVGLVAANCVAMLGRAVFSVHFAAKFFAAAEKQQGQITVPFMFARLLRQTFPSRLVILSFASAYYGTRSSMNWMEEQVAAFSIETGSFAWFRLAMQHIAIGTAFGIGILSLAYTVEREFRRNIRTLWHHKQD